MPAPRRFRYTPRMLYSLVILDLDGTLADSFPWFLRHVNDVADRFGFRRIEEDEIEPLRRAGSREILKRLEVPLWKLPLIARHMRRLKAAHIGDIPLFPEVEPMLRALHLIPACGLRWSIQDNEANACRQLGTAAELFTVFACGASIFGKAAKFRHVLGRAGISHPEAIAIGDEGRDIEAARAAGIACAAVTWGYAAPSAPRARTQFRV